MTAVVTSSCSRYLHRRSGHRARGYATTHHRMRPRAIRCAVDAAGSFSPAIASHLSLNAPRRSRGSVVDPLGSGGGVWAWVVGRCVRLSHWWSPVGTLLWAGWSGRGGEWVVQGAAEQFGEPGLPRPGLGVGPVGEPRVRSGSGCGSAGRVALRCGLWLGNVEASAPAASATLCEIAAQTAQAAFTVNAPEGRCANAESFRSARACSMVALSRWWLPAANIGCGLQVNMA